MKDRGAEPAGDEAVEEYAEIWAAHASAARTLRAVAAGLLLLCLVLAAGWHGAASRQPKPVFVRVDEIGRAEVVAHEALEFDKDPLDPTAKYFLAQFVRDHFGRDRATSRAAWTRSLYFLTKELADAAIAADTEGLAEVAAGAAPEARVDELVLRIVPRPAPPHEATATYELVEAASRAEVRTKWTVTMHFSFLDEVPANFLAVNPVGLLISYVRADEALTSP